MPNSLNLAGVNAGKNLTYTAAIIIGAVLAKAVSMIFVRVLIKRFEDSDPTNDTPLEKRVHTLESIINNAISVLIMGVAFVMILSQWGINIAPILTGAGVIGLAIGFGSQTLVKDVVTGFFILLENQFNIGDFVKVGGFEGRVKEMNLRTTVLTDTEGVRHTIPNSSISTVTLYKDAPPKKDDQ